jgi:hypothetical protein
VILPQPKNRLTPDLFAQFAPIASQMAGEKLKRILMALAKSFKGTGSCENLAQRKSWSTYEG